MPISTRDLDPAAHHEAATWVGISGHQSLPQAALAPILSEVRRILAGAGPGLVGVTSLAAGADQFFAREVLAAGGRLHAVLPSHRYEDTLTGADRSSYQELLAQATSVETLPYPDPSEEAFYAAGRRIVDLCGQLVAVWDGKPARGLGGTADVVSYAQQVGRRTHVVWPVGVVR